MIKNDNSMKGIRLTTNNRWMMAVALSFILYHLSFIPAGAQTTFTQRIQKPVTGQGTVTIHQDESIDKLVNSAPLTTRPAATTAKGTSPAPAKTATTPTTAGTTNGTTPATTTTGSSTSGTETPDVDTPKKTGRTYKVSGYRVQVYAGYNREGRQKAEQARNNIRAQYTNVSVYVHYNNPRWICRVGNYRTSEEAHQMLLSLRKLGYTEASVVRDKITVQY